MIILLGDYSSVHLELSNALKEKKIDVVLMSDGDSYKKLNCDIELPRIKIYKSKVVNRVLFAFRFTGLFGVVNFFKVKGNLDKIGNIKVVQIINPVVIPSLGAIGNILLIRYIRKRADVFSMCALGDDYHWVKSCLNKRFKYSAIDRVFSDGVRGVIKHLYILKYVYSPLYMLLDFYAQHKVDMIIPGLMDYKIAYGKHKKLTRIINLPISDKNFQVPVKTQYPVKIFHAWQEGKESRKGNDLLNNMVVRYIDNNGKDRVQYEIVSNLPYNEYLKKYKESDIILDQVYSYDRGVTGALGMAAGKLVVSGFEEGDFVYGVNAVPDQEQLYSNFCKVMESLDKIDEIKWNAYNYAKSNYSSSDVCDSYLKIWGEYK